MNKAPKAPEDFFIARPMNRHDRRVNAALIKKAEKVEADRKADQRAYEAAKAARKAEGA